MGRETIKSEARLTPVEIRPLPSRLRPPRPHVDLILRETLVERLRQTGAPLICVSAPAGYGKTTLLSQWVEKDGRPFAWLQLAGLHNDPVAFLSYVVATVSAVAQVDPGLLESLQTPEPPVEGLILPELCRALEAAAPFLLVLDDAHLVDSETCWEYLELLRASLPREARLALASRSDPSLQLARSRAGGEVLELRLEDLRMSAAETHSLLAAHGFELGAMELAELMGATEGWATGVYLAILAGDGCPTGELLARLHGDRRAIAEYLTTEVLDRQPAEVQKFLISTSVLDQLSAGLCREVTEMPDAAALLNRITRENLFVTPLDDRMEWYRYHHLFGELLKAQLRRRTPEADFELHRRASAWYAANGDGERAAHHALASGDASKVLELAAQTIDGFACVGQVERARSLLLSFSDDQIRAEPVLALTALTLGMVNDDERVERLALYAESLDLDDGPTPVGSSSLRAWQALTRASRGRGGATAMYEDAALAVAAERSVGSKSEDPSWYRMALCDSIVACYLLGRRRELEQRLAELTRQDPIDDDEDDQWLGTRAFMAIERGDWEEAERLEGRVHRPEDGVLFVVLARARLLAHRDDPEFPVCLADAEALLRRKHGNREWRMLLAADVFGEIALGRDDPAEAERWAAEAEALLARWPDAGVLRGRTKQLREALEERRMAEPLSPAERRVLDLLPTQLTAEQIAARLFLAKNTVKSHMSHIYRKLGVTTRTEAVETARRLGLL